MKITEITKDNFDAEVLKSDKPVLVDFWAAWCGPCQMLGPVMEKIAEEHDEIKVCKSNVDENPELAVMFGIDSIPCVIAFKGGKQIDRSVGYVPAEKILSMVK